jgi:hypothetical protein
MTEIFNNLLKITLNIEGDSNEIDNIKFNPSMLYNGISNGISNNDNMNNDGLLFPNDRKLSNMIREESSSSSSSYSSYSSYSSSSCKNYSKKNRDLVLNILTKKWDTSIDTLYRNNVNVNDRRKEQSGSYLITSNIDFIKCFFFNKYNILTHLTGLNDNNVYIISKNEIKKDQDTGKDYTIDKATNTDIDGVRYNKIYNLTLNLTLINILKPVYLTLKLAAETDKKRFNPIFNPNMMIDSEIKQMKDSDKISMFFSTFILLDENELNKLVSGNADIELEKKKIFTDEKMMNKWMNNSLNKNNKLSNWYQTNVEDIPKLNLKLINKIFFKKDSKLELEEDKYYTINQSNIQTLSLSYLEVYNNKLRLKYNITFNLTLKEFTENDLITLAIKVQYDSSVLDTITSRKNRKVQKEFIPSMVNKSITDNEDKVFFMPYLQLPSVNELKQFNENYMRLFTNLAEFIKLVEYLKYKNQFKKPFNLSNQDDVNEVQKIIQENIKIMKDVFFPPNGEINLSKKKKIVGYNENKKNELITDEDDNNNNKDKNKNKTTFFISKSDLINENGFNFISIPPPPFKLGAKPPLKYTIMVDLALSDHKLSTFDLTFNCKDNTKKLDKEFNDLFNSKNANANGIANANKPYTFFSDIMKPDIQTLDDVRHPLYINSGGALKKKKNKRKTQKVKKYLRKKINIRSSIRKRKY